MTIARGNVRDRPFGLTIFTVAAKGFTGDLVLTAGDRTYRATWRGGEIIAAKTGEPLDELPQVAVAAGLITKAQADDALGRLATSLGRSLLDLVAEAAQMGADRMRILARRALAQKAARLFSMPAAEFVLEEAATLSPEQCTEPLGCHWLIYNGARLHYDETRFADEMSACNGLAFTFRGDPAESAKTMRLAPPEAVLLRGIAARPMTIEDTGAAAPQVDRRTRLALLYTLYSTQQVALSDPRGPWSQNTIPPVAAPNPRGQSAPSSPPGRPLVAATAAPTKPSEQETPGSGSAPEPSVSITTRRTEPTSDHICQTCKELRAVRRTSDSEWTCARCDPNHRQGGGTAVSSSESGLVHLGRLFSTIVIALVLAATGVGLLFALFASFKMTEVHERRKVWRVTLLRPGVALDRGEYFLAGAAVLHNWCVFWVALVLVPLLLLTSILLLLLVVQALVS